jgi:SAM-dependent MidA family methyltransferase
MCFLQEADKEAEEVFTIVMAHEFFDAMPVNLFEVIFSQTPRTREADGQKRGNAFEEVMVDIDPAYDPL